MKKQYLIVAAVIVAAVAAMLFLLYGSTNSGEFHAHADFKVYLNGDAYNFSQERYMEKLEAIHIHDMNGEMIHMHERGAELGDFFSSMGMSFNSSCFVLDDGTEYCSGGDKTLRMYVNGKPNNEYGKYQIHDLDRILITYGSESEDAISQQMASVSDTACIFSEKCPERGSPPPEVGCVGNDNVCEE